MGYSRVAKKLNEAKKTKKQQFSLRKSSVVGVASVIVGTVGFLSGTVQADDLTEIYGVIWYKLVIIQHFSFKNRTMYYNMVAEGLSKMRFSELIKWRNIFSK